MRHASHFVFIFVLTVHASPYLTMRLVCRCTLRMFCGRLTDATRAVPCRALRCHVLFCGRAGRPWKAWLGALLSVPSSGDTVARNGRVLVKQ